MTENKATGMKTVVEVSVFPRLANNSKSLELPLELPERLARAINDTERAYHAGLFSSALTSGRRALEGIFKTLHKDNSKGDSLYDLFEKVCATNEASKPLSDLSHAIRKGGNLGAHFDMDVEADEDTAEAVLELLQYIVSYFFLMPEKIEALEKQITH